MLKSCQFDAPLTWVCPNCGTIPPKKVHYPVVCACGLVDKGDGSPRIRTESVVPSYRSRGGGGYYGEFSQERRIKLAHEVLERKAADGAAAWEEIHCYEGNDLNWLEGIWEPLIPRYGCNCEESYRTFKKENPPDFSTPESAFAWGNLIHNLVNRKLHKREWSLREAMERWRPHIAWQHRQPRIEGCVAVTSVSPRPAHREVQRDCISSWKRLGLDVVSGNMAEELSMVRSEYPEVRAVEVGASASYGVSMPRIRDLARLHGGKAVLLINSDIAIHGNQSRIVEAIKNRQATVFIRQNWEVHPGRSIGERWGIDAFLLFPEQADSLPDLDFAIGQPMWDYWIPYHLEQMKCSIDWVGDPYIYHRSHPIHWEPVAVSIGDVIMRSHYQDVPNWAEWRAERPWGGEQKGRRFGRRSPTGVARMPAPLMPS